MSPFVAAPRSFLVLLVAGLLAAGASMPVAMAQATPDFAAIVAAADRSDADREIDKRRDPVQLLAFTGLRTGMKVLENVTGAAGSLRYFLTPNSSPSQA